MFYQVCVLQDRAPALPALESLQLSYVQCPRELGMKCTLACVITSSANHVSTLLNSTCESLSSCMTSQPYTCHKRDFETFLNLMSPLTVLTSFLLNWLIKKTFTTQIKPVCIKRTLLQWIYLLNRIHPLLQTSFHNKQQPEMTLTIVMFNNTDSK